MRRIENTAFGVVKQAVSLNLIRLDMRFGFIPAIVQILITLDKTEFKNSLILSLHDVGEI